MTPIVGQAGKQTARMMFYKVKYSVSPINETTINNYHDLKDMKWVQESE